MFRKHPSQYTDDELRVEVKRVVDEQVQEGKRLDYKQSVSLKTRTDRREVAKDISSFANEIGGAVLYGIAEDRKSNEVALPMKPFGMKPIPDFEMIVENVCSDLIAPRLPDLHIRRVETGDEGKVVYVVWHPESWMAPHMVEGDEVRYYRRGELRVQKMTEREVKDKYAQARAVQGRVSEFLDSEEVNFYAGLSYEATTHFTCVPLMLLPGRLDLLAGKVKNWLEQHRAFTYDWRPSYHGACASAASPAQREAVRGGSIADRFAEVHHNACVNSFAQAPFTDQKKDTLSLLRVLERLDRFLAFCGELYGEIACYDPVRLRVRILGCSRLKLFLIPHGMFEPGHPISEIALRGGDDLHIEVLSTAAVLTENHKDVLKAAADRVYQAFGVPEADCFESDMSFKTAWTTRA